MMPKKRVESKSESEPSFYYAGIIDSSTLTECKKV